MANYAGSAPAPAVAAAPAAPATAPTAQITTTSQAFAPEPAAQAKPVLPQGVVDADEAARAALSPSEPPTLDANPYKTATSLEGQLSTMGVDPVLAKFYGGRVLQALQQPAPSPEQLAQGHAAAEQALAAQYGEDAEHVGHLAREEMRLMTRDFPDLPQLLERTGLGNDLQVIKALASRGYERLMAQKRAEFGLPPLER